MNICPNCGKDLDDLDICDNCSYDFNSVISCPLLVSKKCLQTNNACRVNGLIFEDCGIYLKVSGIKS